MFILAERNGQIYAKETWRDQSDPVEILNWWSLGISFYTFASWFRSEEDARQAIGSELSPLDNPATRWIGIQGWTFSSVSRTPLIETINIPEPKQRGRKMTMQWHKGAWYKQTAKGLVRA